LTKLETV